MSRVCMEEIDFFEMERRKTASKPSSPDRAPSSLRGIQSVVSRINPQLLKTVMATGRTGSSENNTSPWGNGKPFHLSSCPSSPTASGDESRTPGLPPSSISVFNPASRRSPSPIPDTAPLTIFYNGTVLAVDLPRDKAEAIIKMVELGTVGNTAGTPEDAWLDGDQQERDLPMTRRKSLQRFLEKRKERLASAWPYGKVTTSRHC